MLRMTTIFQIIAATVTALFLYYGMDVRRKAGARDFVASLWQTLMKVCSLTLMGVAAWMTFTIRNVNAGHWLALAMMISGTGFVTAAKRALGASHTFTGQYLDEPKLVTRGVYAFTRNPLYFGVLQCELGASLIVGGRAAELSPENYHWWLAIFAAALVYALSFNWAMAARESRYLERYFGDEYRRYSARVPFVFSLIRR
jgi:protein-S-isoprenylcysteine O-methyltransferase Ste14